MMILVVIIPIISARSEFALSVSLVGTVVKCIPDTLLIAMLALLMIDAILISCLLLLGGAKLVLLARRSALIGELKLPLSDMGEPWAVSEPIIRWLPASASCMIAARQMHSA